MTRAVPLLPLLGILCILSLSAQEIPAPAVAPSLAPIVRTDDAASRLSLAASSSQYPVTPGDIYRITYQQAGTSVGNDALVQSDYTLNLGIFGVFDARDLTFTELRPLVEKKVAAAYPRSTPSLTIASVGAFQVRVQGEVSWVSTVTAWGLSRLSDVVSGLLAPYSSVRSIRVVSLDGRSRTYDLFQAQRFGRQDQDPLIRPGDVIEIARRDREVQLSGEVLRPGIYQLLKGEGLGDLIDRYGGGLTRLADPSRIRIERVETEASRAYYVDLKVEYRQVGLEDGDVITVRTRTSGMPVVFLEGAVLPRPDEPGSLGVAASAAGSSRLPGAEGTVYNRLTQPFKPGETLFGVLEENWLFLSPYADLTRAYLLREGQEGPIPINLELARRGDSSVADMELAANDRLVIPSRLFVSPATVSVFGSVLTPGQYPYVPGRDYLYYLDLAGGIDPARNRGDTVHILNTEGKTQRKDYLLRPGDRIYIPENRFIENFNRYFPVVSTSLAIAGVVISLMELAQR